MSAIRAYQDGKPVWLPEEPRVGRLTGRYWLGRTLEVEHGKPELVRKAELVRRREQRAAK